MSRLGTVWNPWREMNRLRQEMDQALAQNWWPERRSAQFPPINLWEDEKGLTLTAELPGVDAAQLDVAVEKDSLTISGHRAAPPTTAEEESYVRRERWNEPFKRTVELPFDVDADKCDASYEQGVLTVKLERAPEQQPKKLTIKKG